MKKEPITSSKIKELINNYFFDKITFDDNDVEIKYQEGLNIINNVCKGLFKSRRLKENLDVKFKVNVSFEDTFIRYQIVIKGVNDKIYDVDCSVLMQKKNCFLIPSKQEVDKLKEEKKKRYFDIESIDKIGKIGFLPPANYGRKTYGIDPYVKDKTYWYTSEIDKSALLERFDAIYSKQKEYKTIKVDELPILSITNTDMSASYDAAVAGMAAMFKNVFVGIEPKNPDKHLFERKRKKFNY